METHYYDTPTPKRFGTVGPLDPELFLTAEESAREIVTGQRTGRYSALEVAAWLEALSTDASDQLRRMEELADPPPAARRFIIDIAILEAIGRFFAGKLRAAVWYEISTGPGGGPAARPRRWTRIAAPAPRWPRPRSWPPGCTWTT